MQSQKSLRKKERYQKRMLKYSNKLKECMKDYHEMKKIEQVNTDNWIDSHMKTYKPPMQWNLDMGGCC